jgi:hypothetical protein
MLDGEVQPDRRGGRRQRVLKKGLILFNDGRASIGCQILDVSDVGAKLMPLDVFSCPSEFVLKLQADEVRQCEVMWRKSDRIGVRFLLPDQTKMSGDRRRQGRRRATQSALIVFNNGHSNMGCQIVDTSELGAKLIPADVYACPRQFVLKPKSGGPRQCIVLWRKGSTIGVRFL